jgi:hypothetical protein
MFRMVVAPGHAKTNRLGGLIMFEKILLGLICASMLVLLAIGGLGLALGIGPMFMSLAYTVIGGAGLVVFSGLLGE